MMKFSKFPRFCLLRRALALVGVAVLASCATGGGDADGGGPVGQAAEKAADLAGKVRNYSLARLHPAKVDVVEVREKDLKKLPTGEEQVTAYQRSPGRFARFFGPVDYQEPDLPDGGLPMDGLLLPSID